jgi:hypothetical protein
MNNEKCRNSQCCIKKKENSGGGFITFPITTAIIIKTYYCYCHALGSFNLSAHSGGGITSFSPAYILSPLKPLTAFKVSREICQVVLLKF